MWLPLDFVFDPDVPENCEDAKCDEEREMCVELENEEVKVAHCVPASEFAVASFPVPSQLLSVAQ